MCPFLWPPARIPSNAAACGRTGNASPAASLTGSSLSGQPFDPETITKLSEALQSVCDTLSLKAVDDAATRLVARKIIERLRATLRGT